LPGYQKVGDDEARARYEKAWGVTLPNKPGLNNFRMVDAILDGQLHALFVVGEELALVDGNAEHVQEALEKVDFLVVQEIFMTRTAQFADVVLPGVPSLEKEGTFVNTERRTQRLYQALEPLGNAKPDWQILTELAAHLGHNWGYENPSDVMDEIARLTPLFAGVSYPRLEGYKSLLWPVAEDGTDTPFLYETEFHFPDGKARLYPLEWSHPSETPDETYDLHLNNGRILEHFHEGSMTYKSVGITAKVPDTFVEVSAELAAERELESGDWVRLTSRWGSIELRVLLSDRVTGYELYVPHNSAETPVNILTASVVDPDNDTPLQRNGGQAYGAPPTRRTPPP